MALTKKVFGPLSKRAVQTIYMSATADMNENVGTVDSVVVKNVYYVLPASTTLTLTAVLNGGMEAVVYTGTLSGSGVLTNNFILPAETSLKVTTSGGTGTKQVMLVLLPASEGS